MNEAARVDDSIRFSRRTGRSADRLVGLCAEPASQSVAEGWVVRMCGVGVMAWCGASCEWLRVVVIVLCAVDALAQVTHVDPVGYTSHEGTRCYDDAGRPQVPSLFCNTANVK
jgi:hypothetical protein